MKFPWKYKQKCLFKLRKWEFNQLIKRIVYDLRLGLRLFWISIGRLKARMSCNYAEGLSPYDNKGVLGVPEVRFWKFFTLNFFWDIFVVQRFDSEEDVNKKCRELADLLLSAKTVVVHTGAGVSTSAGIPDFRWIFFLLKNRES